MSRLAAVVGLTVERTILRRSSAFDRPASQWIATAGANAARAEALAQDLLSRGATALISIGIAGGLDPRCRPGLLVLASEVIEPGGARLATDEAWRRRLAGALTGLAVSVGPIAGADQMLTSVHQKADLHRRTSALAVDMESHGVARAAMRQSVPFLALRAVADPAGRGLPESAVAGLDAQGRTRPGAMAAALLARPSDIPALFEVAADAAIALARLWQAIGQAGRDLAPR